MTRLALALLLLLATSAPAFAWKPWTHLYLAEQAEADALDDGKVTFYCVDYAKGEVLHPVGDYKVDPDILASLKAAPGQYRAGVLGPDVYPDILTGQQVIHPGHLPGKSDAWLQHLWRASHTAPYDTPAIKAFALGYMTHAAGDMYAHTFVNYLTGGEFSIGPNAVKHISLEGYIYHRTPRLRYEVASIDAGVREFIFDQMVRARRGTPLRDALYQSPGAETSFPRIWSDQRSTLEAGLTANPDNARDIGLIDNALLGWVDQSHQIGLILMMQPPQRIADKEERHKKKEALKERLKETGLSFTQKYMAPLYGVSPEVVSTLRALQMKLPQKVQDFLWYISRSTVDALLTWAYGMTVDQLLDTETEPGEVFASLGVSFSQHALDEYMGMGEGDAHIDYTRFPPAWNTVVMSKLILLPREEVNRLVRDLGGTGTLSEPNAMLGFIPSMDAQKQWLSGMVLARNPDVYRQLFMHQLGEDKLPEPRVSVATVKPERAHLRGGEATDVEVSFPQVLPGCHFDVKVTSSDPVVTVPEKVLLERGKDKVKFTVQSAAVDKQHDVTISVNVGEGSAGTASLKVTPGLAADSTKEEGTPRLPKEEGAEGTAVGPTIDEVIKNLAPLTSKAEKARDDAKKACQYIQAAAAQEELVAAAKNFVATSFPKGAPPDIQKMVSELEAELATLKKTATAQEAANVHLQEGLAAIRTKHAEPALAALEKAAEVPDIPKCLYDEIMSTYNGLKADIEKRMKLIDQAEEEANNKCDYAAAQTYGEQVEAEDANLSWVKVELPKIKDLNRRQKQARTLARQAEAKAAEADAAAAAGNKDQAILLYDQALQIAQQALAAAPACEKENLKSLLDLPTRKANIPADCSGYPGSSPALNPQTQKVECYCNPGLVWNAERNACIDPQELVRNTDCSGFPGSHAAWNEQNQRAECFCPPGKTWNATRTACVDDPSQVNCWPGSSPALNPQTQKVECYCNPGLVWNAERNACIDPQELVRNTDCSGFPGSYAAWNEQNQRAECFCPPGKTWNATRTACVDDPSQVNCWPGSSPALNPQTQKVECYCNPGLVWNAERNACIDPQELVRNTDCSGFPGSYAAWNEQNQRAECFCPPGKTWNATRTACVDDPSQVNCWPGSSPALNPQTQKVECYCNPGLVWNAERNACIDPQELVRNTDCSGFPGSYAAWNEQNQRAECFCPPGKTWNATQTACVDDPSQANCWPGSSPALNPQTQKVECYCNPGLVWNAERNACIDPQELARNTDCSGFPGSYAAWNEQNQRAECFCPPGKTWNATQTACVDGPSQANCYPGSSPALNPQTQKVECYCNPGLVWNSTKTACVQAQNATDRGIGTIVVTQRNVTVSVWDHGCEDGDIITLLINGQVYLNNHVLTNARRDLNVTLNSGTNHLEIIAVDSGTDCPPRTDKTQTRNSAAIHITNAIQGGDQSWELAMGARTRADFIVKQ